MKQAILICLACLAAPAACMAQGTPRAASPATMLDFGKPQFDTETPQYDMSDAGAAAASTVVANVGGQTVTLGDVGDAIRAMPPSVQTLPFETVYPAVLNQLIQIQAMVVRARRRGLDKDPAVMRRVKAAADRALTNELMQREAGGGITEKMLLDRYDRDYAHKPGPEEAHVRVIMVGTEAEANALIDQLDKGADFATLARQNSRDSSGPNGGDLGFISRDHLTPEIGAAAFALKPGETAAHPVRTGIGWFVVRVDERRQGAPPPFVLVRDDIRKALLGEGYQAVGKAALSEVEVHTFDITGKAYQAELSNGK